MLWSLVLLAGCWPGAPPPQTARQVTHFYKCVCAQHKQHYKDKEQSLRGSGQERFLHKLHGKCVCTSMHVYTTQAGLQGQGARRTMSCHVVYNELNIKSASLLYKLHSI